MKTVYTNTFRLFVAAAAVAVSFGFAATAAQADTANVPTVAAVHVGPGAGSVKAPFIRTTEATSKAPAAGPMVFHVDESQAPIVTVGPSQHSVKSPGIH
jgi:hypothetical protein